MMPFSYELLTLEGLILVKQRYMLMSVDIHGAVQEFRHEA